MVHRQRTARGVGLLDAEFRRLKDMPAAQRPQKLFQHTIQLASETTASLVDSNAFSHIFPSLRRLLLPVPINARHVSRCIDPRKYRSFPIANT